MTQYANSEQETWQQLPVSETIVIWSAGGLTAELTEAEVLNVTPVVGFYHMSDYLSVPTTTATWSLLGPVPLDELTDDPVKHWEIEQAHVPEGEPYRIIKPIPVTVEPETDTGFTATFDAGNISISGETLHEAFQWLVLEILDTLDTLLACRMNLGSGAQRQLRILSEYIAKTDSPSR
jgi:hypothetical protein